MPDIHDKMQRCVDRLGLIVNDDSLPNWAVLAVLRIMHDTLLPKLNEGQRSWYEVLTRETDLVLINQTDGGAADGRVYQV